MLQRISLAVRVSVVARCAAPSTTDDATFTFGDQAKVCVPGGAMTITQDDGGRVEYITLIGPAVVRTTDGTVLLEVPACETVSGTFGDDGAFHPDPPVDETQIFGIGIELPF